MKYPQIPHDKKKSTKLKLIEIETMKMSYSRGTSIPRLAEIYNVHPWTVKYWVDDKFHQEQREKRNKMMREKRKNEEFRKKDNKRKYAWDKNQRQTNPLRRAYDIKKNTEWGQKNPEKHILSNLKYIKKNPDKVKKWGKISYERNKEKWKPARKKWHKENAERERIRSRRVARAKTLSAFRAMFKEL